MTAKKTTTKKKTTRKPKKIRVGVIGVGRGDSFARGANDLVGMELVAICDHWKEKVDASAKRYTDYDKFLEHDMDAVILANYFHEHAPFAIKALEAGKHVMSECTSNATMAEGVALCRAVENSKKIYILLEAWSWQSTDTPVSRPRRSVCGWGQTYFTASIRACSAVMVRKDATEPVKAGVCTITFPGASVSVVEIKYPERTYRDKEVCR